MMGGVVPIMTPMNALRSYMSNWWNTVMPPREGVLFFIHWLVLVFTIILYDLIVVRPVGGELILSEGDGYLRINGLFIVIGLCGIFIKFLTRNIYVRIVGTVLIAFGLLGFTGLVYPCLQAMPTFVRVIVSAVFVLLVHYSYAFLQSYRWDGER